MSPLHPPRNREQAKDSAESLLDRRRQEMCWGRTRYPHFAQTKKLVTVAEGATPQVTVTNLDSRLVCSVTEDQWSTRTAPLIHHGMEGPSHVLNLGRHCTVYCFFFSFYAPPCGADVAF
ncbi:hypothetical protein AVEN_258468-1 [Araneus ventricosus]|uniref:Uncharacterized protein n=1 Tax=Araneus ventricosus TaxID=182803 RepID=A0A4Y2JT11_ARAVE|nr:hypothetical protein AVEN_258468-1 [Araneus ventricosus]